MELFDGLIVAVLVLVLDEHEFLGFASNYLIFEVIVLVVQLSSLFLLISMGLLSVFLIVFHFFLLLMVLLLLILLVLDGLLLLVLRRQLLLMLFLFGLIVFSFLSLVDGVISSLFFIVLILLGLGHGCLMLLFGLVGMLLHKSGNGFIRFGLDVGYMLLMGRGSSMVGCSDQCRRFCVDV